MKKLTALILTVIFVLALSACEKDSGEIAGSNNTDSIVSLEQAAQGQETSVEELPANSDQQAVSTEQSSQSEQKAQSEQKVESKKPAAQSSQSKKTDSNSQITRSEAINIALKHAGLKKADVRGLEAELDRERSTVVWEVDFEKGRYDYSYDINAKTGKIIKSEREIDD